ncbi:MAG: hypothetical protein ABEK01_04275 [Candidatus Nanohaloarchaea archaeon]
MGEVDFSTVVDDLEGRPVLERGERLFRADLQRIDELNRVAKYLKEDWPTRSPQRKMYDHVFRQDYDRFSGFEDLAEHALQESIDEVMKKTRKTSTEIERDLQRLQEMSRQSENELRTNTFSSEDLDLDTLKEGQKALLMAGDIYEELRRDRRREDMEVSRRTPMSGEERTVKAIVADSLVDRVSRLFDKSNTLRNVSESSETVPAYMAELYGVDPESAVEEDVDLGPYFSEEKGKVVRTTVRDIVASYVS